MTPPQHKIQIDDLDALNSYCTKATQPIIAIVISNPMHADMLCNVIPQIEKQKLHPIIINLTNRLDTPAPFNVDSFYLTPISLPKAKNISVIVAIDSILTYPKSSRVITIPHGLIQFSEETNAHTTAFSWYDAQTLKADAVFLSHPLSATLTSQEYQVEMGNRFPDILSNRDKDFVIIPGGYLKNDLLMERIESSRQTQSSILVMPTLFTKSETQYATTCKEMVYAACDALPNDKMTVTFRPYPSDRQYEEVRALEARFANDPRIIIDQATSNIDAFSKAPILVTDASMGRESYSLATGRPHVTYTSSNQETEQLPMGLATHSSKELTSAIKTLLGEASNWQQKVQGYRDSKLLNAGHAYEILADSIKAFACGKERDYWISFERSFIKGDWENPDDWNQLLQTTQTDHIDMLQNEAHKRFPEDPRFLVPLQGGLIAGLKLNYTTQSMQALSKDTLQDYQDRPETLPPYAIWGCSQNYKSYYQGMARASREQWLGFFDNDASKWGTDFDEAPVHAPATLSALQPEIVFIATYAKSQVSLTLYRLLKQASSDDN